MSILPFLAGASMIVLAAALAFLGWLALAGASEDDCASRASGAVGRPARFNHAELQQ